MDPNDVFRRFFGLPNRPPHFGEDHPSEDRGSGVSGFGGGGNNSDGFPFHFGGRDGDLGNMFEHFHHDMWTQMEALHRQMEDIFKGFGTVDFPQGTFDPPSITPANPADGEKYKDNGNVFIWSSHPSPFFSQREKKSPRDFMLKDDAEADSMPKQPSVPAERSPLNRSKFGNIFSLPPRHGSHPQKQEDTDLDGKISDDKILELIKKPHEDREPQTPPIRKPGFFSFGNSVNVTTVRGADGKMEEKRTVKDSSGKEESTVTRTLGDKSYTVTTVTGEDGRQEMHQAFQNMDEKDLPKFEIEWSKPKQSSPQNPADSLLPGNPADSLLAPRDKNLFSRLFDWRK